MGVILCTIPRTGTHFFKGILQQKYGYASFDNVLAGENGLNVCHATDDVVERLRGSHVHIVTTIRTWADVMDSWDAQGRNTDLLGDHLKAWLELLTLDPIIVSFEHQRADRLCRLCDALGAEFKTDWTPVNGR